MPRARRLWPPLEFGAAVFSSANLIGVKDRFFWFAILFERMQKEVVMPIDSVLVSAAVVAMFVIFAVVLAWGDRQTRQLQPHSAESRPRRRSF